MVPGPARAAESEGPARSAAAVPFYLEDPSEPGYRAPEHGYLQGGYAADSGRRPSKGVPERGTLRGYGIDTAGKTVDLASMPLVQLPVAGTGGVVTCLDAARVRADLLRTGAEAHCLSTIAVRDAAACIMYDIAVNEACLDPSLLSRGDIRVVVANIGCLVGRLMPVFGQVKKPVGEPRAKRARLGDAHLLPVEPLRADGSLPRPHSFALRPVQLSTVNPADSHFLCCGVVVSNKCYNFPEGDPARVHTGRNPAFEEAVCWVLVTHAFEGLTYSAVNPPRTKTVDGRPRFVELPDRNLHEHVFRWRAWMQQRMDAGVPFIVSTFESIKQTGKDMLRRVLPWTLEDIGARLRRLRQLDLDAYLRDMPLVDDDINENLYEQRHPSGLDLRRMLLVEMLLAGSPLEGLLAAPDHPERGARVRVPTLVVPGGARGLYDRMKLFCDVTYGPPPAAADADADAS